MAIGGTSVVEGMLDLFGDILGAGKGKAVKEVPKFKPAAEAGAASFFQPKPLPPAPNIAAPRAPPPAAAGAGATAPVGQPTSGLVANLRNALDAAVAAQQKRNLQAQARKAGNLPQLGTTTAAKRFQAAVAAWAKPKPQPATQQWPAAKNPFSQVPIKSQSPLVGGLQQALGGVVPGVPPGWKQVGQRPGGHVQGGFFEDPGGQRWYVKVERNQQLARNEALANALYKIAGVKVPEMEIEGSTIRTKAFPNAVPLMALQGDKQKQALDVFKKDFAADVWVANYDVHGQNVLVDKNNPSNILRIDPGGALDYTGWGNPKRAVGLNIATDTESDVSHVGSALIQDMTTAELTDSVRRLRNVTRDQVAGAVAKFGPKDPIAQRNYTNLLMRRRNNALEFLDQQIGAGPMDMGARLEARRKALGPGMVGSYLPSDKDIQRIKSLDAQMGGRGYVQTVSDPATAKKLVGPGRGQPQAHEILVSVSDYKPMDLKGQDIANVNFADLVKEARAGYYPGVIIEHANVGGKDQTVLLNLDSALIRAAGAKFDPNQIHINDLLAGGAAVTISSALGAELIGEAKAAQPEHGQEDDVIVHVGNTTLHFPKGMSEDEMRRAIKQQFGAPEDKSGYDVGSKPTEELYGAESLIHEAEKPESVLRTHPEDTGVGRAKQKLSIAAEEVGLSGKPEPEDLPHKKGTAPVAQDGPIMSMVHALFPSSHLQTAVQQTVESPFGLVSPTVKQTFGVPEWLTESAASLGASLLAGRVLAPIFGWKPTTSPLSQSKVLQKIVSDDLFKLRGWITADKAEIMQHLKSMPPEYQTADMQEKFYHALEEPALRMKLTIPERQIFEKYILPMRVEIQKLSQVAHNYKVPIDDDEWVHRVVKGQEGLQLPHETGMADVPQLGTRSLQRKTSAMMERGFYVLVDEQGNRRVVSQPAPGLLTLWKNGTKHTEKTNAEIKPGEFFIMRGQRFTVEQAKTPELEHHTPYRYQKSAAVNLGDALVKMRSVVRNIKYLDILTQSPEWRRLATKDPKMAKSAGWANNQTALPQLKDWYMHPHLLHAINDFYHPGLSEAENALDPLRRINRFATASLFWNPEPHVENVLGHWIVGRGFSWLPGTGGWKSLFLDGSKAIKSVVTLDDNYKRLLKRGNALIYGGVQNSDFYRKLGEGFGLTVSRDHDLVDRLNAAVGSKLNPTQWVRSLYEASNRIMWQANDVLMMQRVLELERKGYTTEKAIEMAEKHIPNYRIPTEVLGSRAFSRMLQDPAFFNFGRYHYGMWNSYANMFKDLLGEHASMQERVDAVGNLMMLGVLAYVLYPMLDYGLEKLFGDSKVRKLRRGPAAMPDLLQKVGKGERTYMDLFANSVTMAPALKEGLQVAFNRDFFTGKPIFAPGEHSFKRVAGQELEHVTSSLLAPYNQGRQAAEALDQKGLPRQAVKVLIGTEDRTARQEKGLAQSFKRKAAEAKYRRKHPAGPIEKALGYE